jgi:hypothetical protein
MKIPVKIYLILSTNATEGDKLFSMNGREKDALICCWYFLSKLPQANKKAQSL